MDVLSLDQQRKERIEFQKPNFDYAKFRSVKQYIISAQLQDLADWHAHPDRPPPDSLALLRELFSDFFAPKKLLGYRSHQNEMQVAVETPNGIHDLDQLSSGERELFFVLTNLYRIRKLPCVVLYDEPERHLNAGLEAKLLPALSKLQSQNQIWIATHGVELIGSVPLADIVPLPREAGDVVSPRIADNAAIARTRILEQLGARLGLQLAANRIVFVEGENSQKDKAILDNLVGPQLPGVLFVASGPAAGVMGAGTRASLLLEDAAKDTRFIMLLDSDYRDEPSLTHLSTKLGRRAFIWPCHEIENVLLNTECIRSVCASNGLKTFASANDVFAQLQACADELQKLVRYERAAYLLASQGYGDDGSPARPRDKDGFERHIERQKNHLADSYSPTAVQRALEESATWAEEQLRDLSWIRCFPGKEILQRFRKQHLPSLPHDLFIYQLTAEIVRSKHTPPAIAAFLEFMNT